MPSARVGRRTTRWRRWTTLRVIDRWIAEEERHEAERRRRSEERRPPPPEWLIPYGLKRTNVDAVHTGECWAAAKSGRCRPVTRQQALKALRQRVPACVHCRPDTALGILDQLWAGCRATGHSPPGSRVSVGRNRRMTWSLPEPRLTAAADSPDLPPGWAAEPQWDGSPGT
ncbi:DUF6233 domain-containing protein [Streptomyces sp. NPDC001480]|uniref:DUF6233 domain-containing protein n=1 Tax=Streptomyces sp. NPDC001480 TaxID=3364577 RepID=UPI003680D943